MKRMLLLAVLAAVLPVAASSATTPPASHIGSVALNGGDVRVLSGGEPAWRPIPAPDGRVAFNRGGSAFPAFSDLWVMNADGTEARRIVERETEGFGRPAWSPTGAALATTGWDPSPCRPSLTKCAFAEVRVHDPASGDVQARIRSGARGAYTFSWSPDGRQIASLGELDLDLAPYTVEVAHADGIGRRVLVRSTYPNWFSEIAWSPRGDRIAYVRKGWIWLVRPTGGEPVRAAKGARLLWSPRGQLLYSSERMRRLLDPATGRSRTLVEAPAYIANWSPDGARLVYRESYADGVSTLAVARASDGRVVSRARIAGRVRHVYFHAGGTRLLYGVS